MRWKYVPKTLLDKIKKRFAIIPVVVEDEWIWLEIYYSYSEEDYGGVSTIRFNTYASAVDWVKKYRLEEEY